MTEKIKGLLDGGPADALGDGAARFEKLIETVKAQQVPPPEPAGRPAPNPLLHSSPGEDWSRRFSSQAIGPEQLGISLSDLAPVPKTMIVPPLAASDFVPARAVAPAPAAVAPAPPGIIPDAPLGKHFGKADKPRRSWLGRIFRRD